MTGIILVDKHPDWTSHDVVAKLRGILHERRIGHSGTLDPMATGLLVCFIGRATRAVEFAEADEKEYIAMLRPGVVTDTQDITGAVLETNDSRPGHAAVQKALEKYRGEFLQTPPMYSAVKIGGQKLYEAARKGVEVDRPPRKVNISEIKLFGEDNGDWLFHVRCSKGTYIRTLCHDVGRDLGCGAALARLRRISCGGFSAQDAHTIDEISSACQAGDIDKYLLPTDSLFAQLPKHAVDAADEKSCRNGAAIKADLSDGIYRVYSSAGEFLLLGRCEKGRLSTIKSFYEV